MSFTLDKFTTMLVKSVTASEPPSATELFLDAHAPTDDELPDDGSGDGETDADDEDEAGSTGLADDIMPLPRSVAKKVAISTKPRKKV